MTLREILQGKKEQIVARWLDEALLMYVQDASVAFGRQKDRFANPVGHSLREGTLVIFEALLDWSGAEKVRQPLNEIIKIRAVQQFAPSAALVFIFKLKKIVRGELGDKAKETEISRELRLFEQKIDEVALAAFDVYAECREQVFEIRTNEMRRSVSYIVDKLNQRENGPKLVVAENENESPRA